MSTTAAPTTDTGTLKRRKPSDGNGGVPAAATSTLKGEQLVTCVLEGVSPMLQHAMPLDHVENVLVRKKRPQAVTDLPLKDMAVKVLWRGPNDEYGVPTDAVLACLIESGRFVKIGRASLSTLDSTRIPAFLRVEGEFLPFEEQGENAWVVDLRRGMMANKGDQIAVGIVRPKFLKWTLPLTLIVDFDEEGVGLDTIRQLLHVAGRRVGLGSFRPAKRGPFGRFQIREGSLQVRTLEEASA